MENDIGTDLKEMGLDGADWIHPAEDMNQCRPLVNTTIIPPLIKKRIISRVAEPLLIASQPNSVPWGYVRYIQACIFHYYCVPIS
jgi:hypothetical protein